MKSVDHWDSECETTAVQGHNWEYRRKLRETERHPPHSSIFNMSVGILKYIKKTRFSHANKNDLAVGKYLLGFSHPRTHINHLRNSA